MPLVPKFKRYIKRNKKSRSIYHSVARKSQKRRSGNILRYNCRQRLVRLLALKDCKKTNLTQVLTPPQLSDDDSSISSPPSSPIYRVPSTKRSILNRFKSSEPRARYGGRRMARKLRPPESSANMAEQQQQQQQQQQQEQQEQQQPEIQPHSTSYMPTTPHYGIDYMVDTELSSFDFYSCAAITSIQQRHQFGTEYEQDYLEYHQLLQRIDILQLGYQLLISDIRRLPNGTGNHVGAKQRIAEELLQYRSRIHYLYFKMVHIHSLIAYYDASLPPNSATARLATAAQDYLQRQQQQSMSPSVTGFNTMIRANENVGSALQPLILELNATNLQFHDRLQEEINNSLDYQRDNLTSFICNRSDQSRLNNIESSHSTDHSHTESGSNENSAAHYDDDECNYAKLNSNTIKK